MGRKTAIIANTIIILVAPIIAVASEYPTIDDYSGIIARIIIFIFLMLIFSFFFIIYVR